MSANKSNRFWSLFAICFLAVIVINGIIVGGLVAWSEYRPGKPIEISLAPQSEFRGNINISGAVANPGLYPFHQTDTLETLLNAAGGTADNDSSGRFELHVADISGEQELQKVDINRAEAWLLEALPGIKEVRAQAIIDYRERNGPFRNIREITRVEGIGTGIFKQIKHLITVAE